MGIEPTSEAWEAPVLPLNYARSLVSDCISLVGRMYSGLVITFQSQRFIYPFLSS